MKRTSRRRPAPAALSYACIPRRHRNREDQPVIHVFSRRGDTPAEAPADTYQAPTEQLRPRRICTFAMFTLTTDRCSRGRPPPHGKRHHDVCFSVACRAIARGGVASCGAVSTRRPGDTMPPPPCGNGDARHHAWCVCVCCSRLGCFVVAAWGLARCLAVLAYT